MDNAQFFSRLVKTEKTITELCERLTDLSDRIEAAGKSLKEARALQMEQHTSDVVEIKLLTDRVSATEGRLIELDTGEIVIEPGEQLPDGVTSEELLAVKVVEFAIAKFELTPDDVAVFWLPSRISNAQAMQIGATFDAVINKAFRHFTFVRGGVDIEVYKGTVEGLINDSKQKLSFIG